MPSPSSSCSRHGRRGRRRSCSRSLYRGRRGRSRRRKSHHGCRGRRSDGSSHRSSSQHGRRGRKHGHGGAFFHGCSLPGRYRDFTPAMVYEACVVCAPDRSGWNNMATITCPVDSPLLWHGKAMHAIDIPLIWHGKAMQR